MKPFSNYVFPFALPPRVINLTAICVVTTALAACGGSGGGTGEGGSDPDADNQSSAFTDTDGDQLLDQEELDIGTDPNNPDTDGDGIRDDEDDLDGDGITNFDEIVAGTNPNSNDSDGDFLLDQEELLIGTDPNNPDTDNDGIIDSDEDADGDNVSNVDELNAGTDPLVSDNDNGNTPSAPMECADTNSSNSDWSDNCQLQVFGDFRNSLYTLGVQRILHCQGFDNGQSFNDFTDGQFGPITEGEVRNFQQANSLVVDGVVGEQTWAQLQEVLTEISGADLVIGGTSYIAYSINGCDATTEQFYQEIELGQLGGWRMAAFPGSRDLIDFSTGSPF